MYLDMMTGVEGCQKARTSRTVNVPEIVDSFAYIGTFHVSATGTMSATTMACTD